MGKRISSFTNRKVFQSPDRKESPSKENVQANMSQKYLNALPVSLSLGELRDHDVSRMSKGLRGDRSLIDFSK